MYRAEQFLQVLSVRIRYLQDRNYLSIDEIVLIVFDGRGFEVQ